MKSSVFNVYKIVIEVFTWEADIFVPSIFTLQVPVTEFVAIVQLATEVTGTGKLRVWNVDASLRHQHNETWDNFGAVNTVDWCISDSKYWPRKMLASGLPGRHERANGYTRLEEPSLKTIPLRFTLAEMKHNLKWYHYREKNQGSPVHKLSLWCTKKDSNYWQKNIYVHDTAALLFIRK